jgi:hypothetical protein
MANIREIYQLLDQSIKKDPNKYILDVIVCNKINKLPKEYGNFLLGLIDEYYVIVTKKKNVTKSDLVTSGNKKNNVLITPYKGKTYDTGKAPQYGTSEISKFPQQLEKIIAAFIDYVEDK